MGILFETHIDEIELRLLEKISCEWDVYFSILLVA